MVTVDFNELYNSKIKEISYRGLIDDIGDMVILLLRAYQDSNMMVNCCIQRYDGLNGLEISRLSNNSFDINGFKFSTIYDFDSLGKLLNPKVSSFPFEDRYILGSMSYYYTLDYLKKYGINNSNICAVTSLIRDISFKTKFNSYIWNKDNDIILDLSSNLKMKKEDYDKLFLIEEINVLNYNDYMSSYDIDFEDLDNACYRLLFLALIKLATENEKTI